MLKAYAAPELVKFPLFGSPVLPCQQSHLDFSDENTTDEHREVCADCPVKVKAWCLEWALKNDEWGTWGGSSREEREAMKEKKEDAA